MPTPTLTRISVFQRPTRRGVFNNDYKHLSDIIISDKVSLRPSRSSISPEAVLPEMPQSLRLRDYLKEVAWAGDVSAETAGRATKAWLRLSSMMSGRLPVPDAAPGPDGELLLTWDRGELHLELELMPNGPAEFFARNRTTGALWGEEYRPDIPLSAGAREQLRKLL